MPSVGFSGYSPPLWCFEPLASCSSAVKPWAHAERRQSDQRCFERFAAPDGLSRRPIEVRAYTDGALL